MAGFVIENFEDTNLVAGLRIGWETPTGTNAPGTTLPALFNPALDPFGNVFAAGVWDGTNGLLNTRDN